MTTAAPPETSTSTWLDERTKAELRPPCEISNISHVGSITLGITRCEHPAEWVVRSRCDRCQQDDNNLMCTGHFEYMRDDPAGMWLCQLCRRRSTRMIVSRSRLR